MGAVSLASLAHEHDYVVLDTSVFIPSGVSSEERLTHVYNLRAVSMNHKNFYSDGHIVGELMEMRMGTRRLVQEIRLTLEPHHGTAKEIGNWLYNCTKDNGLVDHTKKYPAADLRIAALAFSLVKDGGTAAFLSSDRNLNELVYTLSSRVAHGDYPWLFPTWVRGTIDVYSFFQKKMLFVPYAEERENLIRSGMWKS